MKSSGAIPKTLGARSKVKLSGRPSSKSIGKNDPQGETANIYESKGENRSLELSDRLKGLNPLEKKEIVLTLEGLPIKKPALDPCWLVKKPYLHFEAPPDISCENSIVGAMDAWVEQAEFLISDLTWLLQQPHYRFWSQMVFDPSVHEFLGSYLANAPRWFNQDDIDPEFRTIIEQIHHLVFRIYLRMATHKESQDDFITPSVFGKILYDNFLFDVCTMLDLCSLYNSSNELLLGKMLSNIFTNQPKYLEDLSEMAISLKQLLESLQARIVIVSNSQRLNGPLAREQYIVTYDHMIDAIHYLVDIFSSVHALFRIFPRAIEIFHSSDYHLSLCTFYEHVIPILEENIPTATNPEDEEWFNRLRTNLRHIRMEALAIYRCIVRHFCFDGICDPGGPSKCMEEFIHLMSTCIEDKIFTVDYTSTYDLESDLNILSDAGADPTSLTFIKEAVQLVIEETVPAYMDDDDDEDDDDQNPNSAEILQNVMTCSDNSGMNGYYVGETSSISDLEITSLVSQIQDLLPDLGSGFIASCLKYFNYSVEDTLNALLAGPLPPCLDSLDRSDSEIIKADATTLSLIEETKVVEDVKEHKDEGLVSTRSNLYDDDEFDVFSRVVKPNLNNMHKGKRKDDVTEKDDELAEKVRALAIEYDSSRGYSIYEAEDKYTPIAEIEYNDEYDDTYDNDYTGDMDVGERKKILVPTMRGKGALNIPLAEESEESEDESEASNPSQQNGVKGSTFRAFCQNPEDLRRKAEERRQAKYSNKFKNKDWKQSRAIPAQPEPDNGPKPQPASKGSGKQWRNNPDDERFRPGGKQDDKSSSQHGKAQDKNYKNKMVNKGNFRRSAAQAKQRSFM